MNTSSHLNELQKKHDVLSKKVETAQRSPGSDTLEISDLKKKKLKLKEQMTKISET